MAEINVKTYGATGDGVTNDTTAIQNAINAARPNGDVVYIPSGTYVVSSTLTINSSADTGDYAPRCSIRGDGANATRIFRSSGTGPVLNILGGSAAGIHSFLTVSDLMIVGNGVGTDGITLNRMAFMTLRGVTIMGCDTALVGKNILSSLMQRLVLRWNQKGFRFEREAGVFSSDPNGITMISCIIGNNTVHGGAIIGGSTFNMVGGSVEGNGQTADAWGLTMSNAGTEGAVGVNLSGVYFEGNKGKADLWLPNSAQDVAHNVQGCTFNRIDATRWVTNNILLETSSNKRAVLTVMGCGFRGFNNYVANASRKYIDGLTSAGGTNTFAFGGNLYGSDIERPTVPNSL